MAIGKLIQGEVKWWQKAVEFVNWTLLVRGWNLMAMHQKCDEIFPFKWRITICENMYKRLRQFILWMLWYFKGWEILDLLGPLNQIQGTLKVFNEFLSNPSNVIFQFGTKRSAPARLETIFGLKNGTWKLYKSWASISNKVRGATGIFLCRPKWNDMQSSITDPSSTNTADFSTRIFKAYISWVK